MPQMEEKISTMEKLSIYLFVYFTYFADSGVAARTPRREQAEGETSLRQNLFLKKLFFIIGEKTFEKPKSDIFQLLEVLKKQEYKTSLYHNRTAFMNRWYYTHRQSQGKI